MVPRDDDLGLVGFLLIAERVLGQDAEKIKYVTKIALAESALEAPHASFGGVDFYPDPVDRAAILCSRLVRNHPLPDGNKRTAYVAMLEQLRRNNLEFNTEDQDEIADQIEALAASHITEEEFRDWVRGRIR